MPDNIYYIYMLRCIDDSIYIGIAKDWKRRIEEHFGRTVRCARYTLSHPALRVEHVWQAPSRSMAAKLEYRIKKLSKTDKESLLRHPSEVSEMLGLENVYVSVTKCTQVPLV